MMKSLLLAAVLCLGLQTDAMAHHEPMPTPAVPALPPAPSHFTVYYRTCDHVPWQKLSCYDCIHDAQYVARAVQAQGYLVMIR